jgi:hypothetical protein
MNTGKIDSTVYLDLVSINCIRAMENVIFVLGINKDLNFVLKSFVCIEVFQVLLFLIKTHAIF